MSRVANNRDWADDEDLEDSNELPQSTTTTNKDGTQTIVTWRFNDDGKKVKTTRRIRFTKVKEIVNPRVAERKSWGKFGLSQKDAAGPASDTTSVGENIIFRPSTNWRKDAKEEVSDAGAMKNKLKDKQVKCRICSGEHFTAKCPFKGTMAPLGEEGAVDVAAGHADTPEGPGGLGAGKSSYVPPHLRNGGTAGGERMGGGKFERDDLATLRVTNVSEMAEEQELRDMFERFGRVTRVFLAKDRETGLAKGFAFISFQERSDAAKACEKMDGYGFKHLILRVEFAKKAS
ncbi:putative eukaryotic translation initiation factor 3 subunit g protein [Botrytis fragariae]|uniref:Eukaryotic translation initiation factor 3 subunit G n=4 Tax=Botrytis TaxID=33196 RepID=EIF3G_BOTFB|nr:Bctif35 [Botrytis cinerea B05.10]XP_037193084.1 putative eukaryotic translation initiation factor 3 subunit g protein [Botrytis fragariae]A6SGN8.1 RecName: Full=Eukaryotic translation initiation factor 3 subunit G; Short=eIF3g; AltName: Full=Eukaryotic translation initiation factor 3 RNA-binding subunit; Short=eIF-3 RNA-binding subunit; AltName: Full=Translation initiation factor eIF3 p33 subunit homolog; Short=eIF3 p33 homolog [Botrytis cinerea B05.10]EMR84712.1 putative eukaryotic translati